MSPLYMNDVFELAGQNTSSTKTSLFKLCQPLQKANRGQKSLSYVAPSIWNITCQDFLKTTENVNTYKHRVKKLFLQNEQ